MNPKKLFLVVFALFQMVILYSQRVEFTYDDNGNRLTRTVIVEQLRENTVKFPVVDPKSLKSAENAKAKGLDLSVPDGESYSNTKAKGQAEASKVRNISEDEEMITVVYPNPNKGLLRIDISNMPLYSINEMRLYDLSGKELIVKRNLESHSEIDISQLQDGIYILRIKINERTFDWKVIKNH